MPDRDASTETKTALLQAAKRLLAERGYAGTRVRDLTGASGTNLAAVNYHFGSKQALLNEALQESFQEWGERIAQAARTDPDGGAPARMLASMRALLDELPENQALFAAFLEGLLQAQRSPELRSQLAGHYAEQRRWVGEIVTAEQPAGAIPERMVEVIASLVLAVVDGLLLQSLLDPATTPTGEELAALTQGLAAASQPHPARRRTSTNNKPKNPPTKNKPTNNKPNNKSNNKPTNNKP
jgi:AcrR family transcriptional regulator